MKEQVKSTAKSIVKEAKENVRGAIKTTDKDIAKTALLAKGFREAGQTVEAERAETEDLFLALIYYGKPEGASGSIVTCSIEGSRPILLEIQALVCHSFFNNPRRTANGTDYNKVNLLMAVLEKRANLSLSDCDAYVNIAGGIRMNEPAIDLGIVLAIASSKKDIIVRDDTICFGEVGLSGEVRGVTMSEQRVAEAKKLGFKKCIVPKVCLAGVSHISGIEIVGVANIKEAIEAIR